MGKFGTYISKVIAAAWVTNHDHPGPTFDPSLAQRARTDSMAYYRLRLKRRAHMSTATSRTNFRDFQTSSSSSFEFEFELARTFATDSTFSRIDQLDEKFFAPIFGE